MNRVLEQIIAKKEEDLRKRKKSVSLKELKGRVGGLLRNEKSSGMRFLDSLSLARNDIYVIGEVKFASPGTSLRTATPYSGDIDLAKDLLERVKQYESAGADAVSIITERHFFKGSIDFVGKVKEAVALPVLQKDFVIDEYQIYEAAKEGTDALLLIARLVDGETLRRYVALTKQLGMEPVVEINDEKGLEKAVTSGTNIIAVNARDFETFHVDVNSACRLMKKIPDTFIKLGFSGILSAVEVKEYREAGARGVLIGTSLMQAKVIGDFIRKLKI